MPRTQTNPGAFRKGHDPRRFGSKKLINGMTLSAMARELTPECLAYIHNVSRGIDEHGLPTEYEVKDRLRACEYILARGWGTPVQSIELNLSDSRPITALNRTELMALAAGEQPRLPVTIPGEAITQAIGDENT
jgi:hypothetical protein